MYPLDTYEYPDINAGLDRYMLGGWSLPEGFSGQSQMGGNFPMSWDLGGMDITMPDIQLPDQIDLGGIFGGGSGDARDRAVSIVNNAERVLSQNHADYKAGNITASECATRFDRIWSQMVTTLQSLGQEGARAIADRQAGGKFDWFSAYRPAGVTVTPGTPSTGPVFTGSSMFGNIDSKTIIFGLVIVAVFWYAGKQGAFK